MKRLIVLLTVTLALSAPSLSQIGSRQMSLNVNGNSYQMFDLFSDSTWQQW